MTRKLKFSDYFWEDDICGTNGYEVLVRRLKDGRQMCKDVEDYLRQRAKIEEDYANKLNKLAKTAGGASEIGTLHNAWEVLRVQTELTAAHHADAQKYFTESSHRLSEFTEQQKNKRKPFEEKMKRLNKKKKDLFKQVMDAKSSYRSKCEEADNCEHALASVKDSMAPKDVEKAKQREAKSKQEAARADNHYKDLVGQLEQTRQQWEHDMAQTAEAFEKMEEERIAYIRNELWACSNVVSQTSCDVDTCCEEVRKGLETCDVDKDINDFIERNKTGTRKPAKIEYEKYYRSC